MNNIDTIFIRFHTLSKYNGSVSVNKIPKLAIFNMNLCGFEWVVIIRSDNKHVSLDVHS